MHERRFSQFPPPIHPSRRPNKDSIVVHAEDYSKNVRYLSDLDFDNNHVENFGGHYSQKVRGVHTIHAAFTISEFIEKAFEFDTHIE